MHNQVKNKTWLDGEETVLLNFIDASEAGLKKCLKVNTYKQALLFVFFTMEESERSGEGGFCYFYQGVRGVHAFERGICVMYFLGRN